MHRLRSAAPLVAILIAEPAYAAQATTAEEAVDRYRQVFRPIGRSPCRNGDSAEIVVCARPDGPDPNRLPLPVEPLPGARASGELPDKVEISKLGTEDCTTVGPHGSCSFIPILPFAAWVVKTAIKAVKAAEEAEEAKEY